MEQIDKFAQTIVQNMQNSNTITLKELATILEMSPTTVSRVLSGQADNYRISKATQQRVKEVAEARKFKPNLVARNLRLKKTNTIGLIVPEIANPFFALLAHIIENELRKTGKMILLVNSSNSTKMEEKSLALLQARKVDGLIIAPVGQECGHLAQNMGMPVVLIDRYFEDLNIPYVATDHYKGAYQATQYLIDNGHRKIACIQGMLHTAANKNRVAGFKQAIEDAGIPETETSVSGSDYSVDNGYEQTKQLIQGSEMPTAIFAMNNLIALGVLKAIREAELIVPNDISLITFDEQPYFELFSPPLTAVKQPLEEIGRAAVQMLLSEEHMESKLFSPELVERKSVKKIKI